MNTEINSKEDDIYFFMRKVAITFAKCNKRMIESFICMHLRSIQFDKYVMINDNRYNMCYVFEIKTKKLVASNDTLV